jgi:hypothetical protein
MAQLPTAADLLAHVDVIDGLRRAFQESGVGTDNPVEQGGFIVLDYDSGALDVVRLPASGPHSLVYPICADGKFRGNQIVGSFHTHPNTGLGWRQEPSMQDMRLSQEYPETMGPHQFVIASDTI